MKCSACGRQLPVRWIRSLKIPLTELPLTTRTLNCLKAEGISYIGQLVVLTPIDVARMPLVGKKTLIEVEEALAERGLKLGMSAD